MIKQAYAFYMRDLVLAPLGWEVGSALAGHGTPFYVSYAHAGDSSPNSGSTPNSDRKVEQFYRDLINDLGQLIYLGPGADLGFMDTKLQGGQSWTPELLHLLGTCQILIPLLSARYVASEWCGMEWHAFHCRKPQRSERAGLPAFQRNIIPVRWAPVDFELPDLIKDEQIFSPSSNPDPDLPQQYKDNGVYGLLQMGKKESYRIIVWQLSMHINNVYRSQHLIERKFRPGQLKNVFDGDSHD